MNGNNISTGINFARFLGYIPTSVAMLRGVGRYAEVGGTVRLYDTAYGSVIFAEVVGLPISLSAEYAFAISVSTHEAYKELKEQAEIALPPLVNVDGFAFSAFLTDKFKIDDINGRSFAIYGDINRKRTPIAEGEIATVRR